MPPSGDTVSSSPDLPWVALAGYMGAGKSTVGPLLARAYGRDFFDADRAIEADAEMPIPEIFSRKGELWFRRMEERVIRDIVGGEPGVLALGGGALGRERTRGLLGRVAKVVWLRLDPEASWERVQGSDRPLADERERFLRRAAQREPVYREAADITIDAALAPAAAVEAIQTALADGGAE